MHFTYQAASGSNTLDTDWPSPMLAALLWLFVPPLVVPMPVVRKVTDPAQHAFFSGAQSFQHSFSSMSRCGKYTK
jgi:hypothetical protein